MRRLAEHGLDALEALPERAAAQDAARAELREQGVAVLEPATRGAGGSAKGGLAAPTAGGGSSLLFGRDERAVVYGLGGCPRHVLAQGAHVRQCPLAGLPAQAEGLEGVGVGLDVVHGGGAGGWVMRGAGAAIRTCICG